MIDEIKGIERRLTNTLGDLKGKLEKLKDEKSGLMVEILALKKAGEKKAQTLEQEIIALRREVDSLKELLDENK